MLIKIFPQKGDRNSTLLYLEARLDKIWQKAGEMGKVYWLKTFGLHKGKDPKVFTAPCRVSNRDFDVEVFSDVPEGVLKRTHCHKVLTQVPKYEPK